MDRLCYLDLLSPEDKPGLIQIFCCPKVRRFLGGPLDRERAEIRAHDWIQKSKTEPIWAIRSEADNGFLGYVLLHSHHEGKGIEMSYALLSEYWGEGYATNALKAVIERSGRDFGYTEVVSETQAANIQSVRLLERVGMHEESRLIRFGEEQIIFRGSTSLKANP